MANKPNSDSELFKLKPADPNLEVIELKVVGREELDRTWRSTVRERHKIQEKKIWDDFCKNEDIVNSVFQHDPYQFLGSLEISTGEDMKPVKQTSEPDQPSVVIVGKDVETHYASGDTRDTLLDIQSYRDNDFIPFIGDNTHEKAASTLILDLDESQEIDSSFQHGQSPSTVRENTELREGKENIAEAADEPLSPENEHGEVITNTNVEFRENVAPKKSPKTKDKHLFNVLQSSVYYERVRELRIKINELLQRLIELFINETNDCDIIELRKLRKRADEFSGRFNRIYIYQLQRQLNDIKRHMSVSLPFGKRTQYQAQTTRVTSLHQNTFQALQMLHHPLEKSLFLGQGGQPLQALLEFIREATDVCSKIVPSNDFTANAHELYDDMILYSCETLEQLVKQHAKSMEILIETDDLSPRTSRRKSPSNRQTGRKIPSLPYQKVQVTREKSPKCGQSSSSRLSLYSVDKLRLNLKPSSKYSSSIRLDKASGKPGGVSSKTHVHKLTNSSEKQLKCPTKRNDRKCAKKEGNETRKCQLSSGHKPLMKSSTWRRKTPVIKNIHEEEIETMVEMESVQNKCLPTNTQSQMKSSASAPYTPKTPKHQEDVPPTERLAAAAAATTATTTPADSTRARAAAGSCDVTALLHQLCGGKAVESVAEDPVRPNRVTRVSGASNAQLVCVTRDSPRRSPRLQRPQVAPSTPTPQLLKILEETIQKQPIQTTVKNSKHTKRAIDSEEKTPDKVIIPDKLLLHFNLPDKMMDDTIDYRRQFIEYMMSSPMYVNTAYNKPWEVVERVTDKVIEELLVNSALEMQLEKVLLDLCRVEVNN